MPIRSGGVPRSEPLSSAGSPDSETSASEEFLAGSGVNGFSACMGGSVGIVPERNKVVLERIRRGLDTRTTIMVKNVPNKYTQVNHLWTMN